MKSASEFQWFANKTIAFWQAYEPAVKVDLSCVALRFERHLLLVDPIPLAKPALNELMADGSPAAIIITSGNHERAAAMYSEQFDIPILAHPDAVSELSLRISATFQEGQDILPVLSNLNPCMRLASTTVSLVPLQLPGGAPGETAFYWNENGGVIILGDAIINLEATGLILLPDKYCTNPKHLALSLEKLTSLPVKILTFAHGLPITEQAAGRLSSLVKAS